MSQVESDPTLTSGIKLVNRRTVYNCTQAQSTRGTCDCVQGQHVTWPCINILFHLVGRLAL